MSKNSILIEKLKYLVKLLKIIMFF